MKQSFLRESYSMYLIIVHMIIIKLIFVPGKFIDFDDKKKKN